MKTIALAFIIPHLLLCASAATLLPHRSDFQQILSVQSRAGYSFDICSSDADCLGARYCYDVDEEEDGTEQRCTLSSKSCSCRERELNGELRICLSSTNCKLGDRCLTSRPDLPFGGCASCAFAARISDDGRVCVLDTDTSNCVGQVDDVLIPLCSELISSNSTSLPPSPVVNTSEEPILPSPTQSAEPIETPSTSLTPSISSPQSPEPSSSASSMPVLPSPTPLAEITESPSAPLPDQSSPTPSSQPSKGYSFDNCRTDSDCAGTRGCYDLTISLQEGSLGDAIPCDSTVPECLCMYEKDGVLDPRTCPSGSTQCSTGERCIRPIGQDLQLCSSCQALEYAISSTACYVDQNTDNCVGSIPSSSMTVCGETDKDDAMCIAVSSLSQMDSSQLVYQSHRTAGVLCDEHDNCATPGHIVEYRGRLMMMKTYCSMKDISGCAKRVRKVNSPKMAMGLRVASNLGDLRFTALAARFETKAEESVFNSLTRFGI